MPGMEGRAKTKAEEDLRAAVAAEHKALCQFVQQHDCPAEGAILEWLEDAVGKGEMGSGAHSLQWVLRGLGLAPLALEYFDYQCLQKLWRAPLAGLQEAKKVQRQVGEDLCEKGGIECMRLHYYMLNYAMCGNHFLGIVDIPPPALYYVNSLNMVWDGVGAWRA